jgi:hypothetical protein
MGKEVPSMSQLLERERTHIPVRHRLAGRRSAILDYTLIIIGALVALVGLYFQFAPSDWWLAHFSEAYHFGGYVLGGLFLAAGFGVFADRTFAEDGYRSGRVIAGITLAIVAVLGAALAVLFWIL